MITRERVADAVSDAAPATTADRALLWFVLVPFCGFFLVAGLLIVGWTGKGIAEGALAAGWPHTTGTLLRMDNELVSPGDYDSEESREVVVRYAYSVGGREYEGSRVHPAYSASSFNDGHAAVARLLAGKRLVRVYHHAENPAVSTLSVGFYTCTLAAFFGGLTFLCFGAGLLGMAVSAMRGDRERGKMYVRVLFVGTFLSLGLCILFSQIGSQAFDEGITVVR